MKQKKRPADCASPGGHAGDLHQGWQSGRGQLSERSQVKLTCLFFFGNSPKTARQRVFKANPYG